MLTSIVGDLGDESLEEMTSLLGRPRPEPETFVDQVKAAFTLTWRQRLIGFAVFFTAGSALSFLSSTFVPLILSHHPERFAIPYTTGNLCSIISTTFLMGPSKQLQSMFAPERFIASLMYVSSLVVTLAVAFMTANVPAVILLIVVQVLAMAWYCASYIPYGREIIKKICWTCLGSAMEI